MKPTPTSEAYPDPVEWTPLPVKPLPSLPGFYGWWRRCGLRRSLTAGPAFACPSVAAFSCPSPVPHRAAIPRRIGVRWRQRAARARPARVPQGDSSAGSRAVWSPVMAVISRSPGE